jgi:tRNA G10  N-methylase Trm11
MSSLIAILGRQPALGLAELESLYGPKAVQPLSGAALLTLGPEQAVDFDRLGGSLKLAKHLTTLNTTDWAVILKYLTNTIPQHLHYIPEGKIRFGLSVYGLPIKPATLNRSGLDIKKIIKRAGRSVRTVPNTEPALSTAQTLHNQLTGPTGMELILVRHGKQTLLGQVTHVQNINAYAARDQKRPMRDARVGMLPPKLAQIIINLANPALPPAESTVGGPCGTGMLQEMLHNRLLDPFCGTGVLLQEALLDGYDVVGSDLEPRMVEYSQTNLEWLRERYKTEGSFVLLEADATSHEWDGFNAIACETYLGRPFTSEPSPDVLQDVMQDVNLIHKRFLQNVARQTFADFRMCIAVPAWKTKNGFKHLKVLDSLEDLGYTRMSFAHASSQDLLYYRPGQIVARELVVLIRK